MKRKVWIEKTSLGITQYYLQSGDFIISLTKVENDVWKIKCPNLFEDEEIIAYTLDDAKQKALRMANNKAIQEIKRLVEFASDISELY